MKKRRKKWRKGTVPNNVFVTLSFVANADRVQQQIQTIIAAFTEAPSDDEPALTRSFPAASLATAEQLLEELKHQIVDVDMIDIKVSMTLNSQYQQGRKAKVTRILAVDWVLSYDFDNLSVPLLQDIFNNPDYISDDYAAKAEFAQGILTELSDVVAADHLALLPTEDEADDTPVKITTKVHAAEVAAAQKADSQLVVPVQSQSVATNDTPEVAPSKPTVPPVPSVPTEPQNSPHSRKVIHASEADTDSILPQVSLPYFDVSDLPVADPEDAGYVSYALNERRKQYNQRIKQLETRLTQDVRRRFQLLDADYRRDIKNQLAETKQSLAPDPAAIKAAQIAQLQPEKARRVAQAKEAAENQKAQEIALAQQQFEAAKQKAEQRAAQQISRETATIEKEFAETGTAALKKAVQQAQQTADQRVAVYEQELNRQALGEQQAAVSEWLSDSAKVGQQLLDSLQGELQRYERETTQIHLDAMQAAAAKHNTEINLQEVHHQAEEVENLQSRLQTMQDKNLTLQGTNQKLQNDVTDMKQKLLEQTTTAQQGEQAEQQDDLLKLFLMKHLDDDDHEQPAPKPTKKPWVAALVSGLIVLVLSGGGFAGYAYVNNQRQQQVAQQQHKVIQHQQQVTRQYAQQQRDLTNKVAGLSQQTQKQNVALAKSRTRQQHLDRQLKQTKRNLAIAQSTTVNQPNREVTITWPNN